MSRKVWVRRLFRGRRRLVLSAIFIALAAPLPGQAALLWNWTYTGGGIAASGTFTTDDAADSGGYYHITGITGSRNGAAIISLEPAGKAIPGNAGFPLDNLVSESESEWLYSIVDTLRKGQANLLMRSCTEAM